MDNPLSNVYTDRDFQYLKSKSLDVCIVVRHRGTKEVTMRSSVPHSEAVKMIRGMENTKEDTWVTEAQKNRFPKSPEPLEDILNCKPKIQKLASKLMSFWNSEVRGRQAMGVGEFKAWNDFEFDLGKTHFLINQFDKIRNDVDKFSLKMVDVIEWKELAGCHGIGTGNLKAVKIDWTWLEVLKFFIVWSYTVVGVGVDENLTDSWTPGAKDFLPKKKKFQPKPKKAKKKPCSESQQNTGKRKGGERSKTTITERNDDFEMAMAMSVTEEIERVRQAENDRESEELAKVLSISLHEVSRESVKNDDGMGVTNQVLTDR